MPVLRFEKAVSVGANTVMPSDFLSRLLSSASSWVLFSSPMKVLKLPAFLRIAVMSGEPGEPEGPEGTRGTEGGSAGGEDWAEGVVGAEGGGAAAAAGGED